VNIQPVILEEDTSIFILIHNSFSRAILTKHDGSKIQVAVKKAKYEKEFLGELNHLSRYVSTLTNGNKIILIMHQMLLKY